MSAGTTSSTATSRLSATTPCWSSSSTAVTPPAPTTSRCCSISTTTTFPSSLTKADKLKKSQLAQTQEEFEKLCLPYGCQKVVLTSGESGYGIPELQAVLNAAVAAEYEANAEDAE